jgi:hypothetical protein
MAEAGEVLGSGVKRKAGRPPTGRPRLSIVLTIKGTQPWREWLDGYAAAKGQTPTEMIDQALTLLAKRDKHQEPPSRVG